MGNVTLALHVLCERASPSSPWLPYIKSLPTDYDTPLYYEEEEVRHLLGTQAVQDVLSQYKNTARQYAYFYKVVQVSGVCKDTHTKHTKHTTHTPGITKQLRSSSVNSCILDVFKKAALISYSCVASQSPVLLLLVAVFILQCSVVKRGPYLRDLTETVL